MILFLSLLSAYVCFGLTKFVQSKNFLLKKDGEEASATEAKVLMLMPVLREQEVILTNLERFSKLKGNYELIYITSEKEVLQKHQNRSELEINLTSIATIKSVDVFLEKVSGFFPTSKAVEIFHEIQNMDFETMSSHLINEYDSVLSTAEIIDEYLARHNLPHVRRVHYSRTDGVMAHQLNYALGIAKDTCSPWETYVIIYNADSVVPNDTVSKFLSEISKGEDVILQSSLFLDNYTKFPDNWRGDIMRFVALAQTRWTLVHEIPRVRRQYAKAFWSRFESAHVVGHGTCIRLKALLEIGGYPQDFTNEDLALGYFLSLKGYRISPLRSLENAESPNTLMGIVKQYKTWFYGAADYFIYRDYAVNLLSADKFTATLWASINIAKACIWLLAPWIWLVTVVVSFQLNTFFGLWVVILFLVHTSLVHFLIVRFLNHDKPNVVNLSKIMMTLSIVLIAPLAYLVWGIGPTLSLKNIIVKKMFGKPIRKEKTER